MIVVLFILCIISYNFHNGNVIHNNVFVDRNHSLLNKEMISKEIVRLQNISLKFINELIMDYPRNIVVGRLRNWSGSIRELPFNTQHILASNTNKGDVISICFVNKAGDLNATNELIWVLLHELAHVMTNEYKHNDYFWENNKFLVNEAVKRGLYKFVEYGKQPVKFCGSAISYNF